MRWKRFWSARESCWSEDLAEKEREIHETVRFVTWSRRRDSSWEQSCESEEERGRVPDSRDRSCLVRKC